MVLEQLSGFFSMAAFLLTLRETMEAVLIVSILLAYLTKTRNDELKKDVWVGTGMALVASVLLAVIIRFMVGRFGNVVIFGVKLEPLFEGMVMITAAVILTMMIIWMFRHGRVLRNELEMKVQEALAGTNRYALMSLAFIAVLREGIETVLFLAGVLVTESETSVIGGGLAGILAAVLLAIGLYRGSIRLDLRKFFNVTSVLLILFAAGLLARGLHEFQELGFFGLRSAPWNVPLWDTSFLLPDNDRGLGTFLRAFFGYQDNPSLIEIIAYFGYWIGAILAFYKINRRSVRKAPPISVSS